MLAGYRLDIFGLLPGREHRSTYAQFAQFASEVPLAQGGTLEGVFRAFQETKVMPTLYIPPGFVPFLDALALPDVDPAEHLQQFKSELTAMQGWYDYNSTHSLDDEEADLLENLRFLVGEMQWAIDNEDLSKKKALLEKLVPNLYQAISVMEQINLKREKAAYSKIPALNDLLIAGACYLMGRGELEAIDFRMEPADLAYQNLRRQLRYSFQRLKPEIGESFRVGVEHLSHGLDELDDAVGKEDRAAIQAGLAQIKDGSDILEHFVSWYQNDQVRLAAQNTTFSIPVLGPTLELNLDAAKKFAKDTWGRGLKTLYEDNLPEFFAFWERAQKQIFVSAQEREELVSRVEEALNELRGALEIMGDGEQTKEAGVQAF